MARQDSGCCGSDSCTGPTMEENACGAGYTADELAEVGLDSSISLGCGNPLLLAELYPGEVGARPEQRWRSGRAPLGPSCCSAIASRCGRGWGQRRRPHPARPGPAQGVVLRDGEAVEVPTSEVAVGDLLLIRPGRPGPIDAIVEEGR